VRREDSGVMDGAGRRAAVARPPAPVAVRDVTAALVQGSIVTAAAYLALAMAAVPYLSVLCPAD